MDPRSSRPSGAQDAAPGAMEWVLVVALAVSGLFLPWPFGSAIVLVAALVSRAVGLPRWTTWLLVVVGATLAAYGIFTLPA